jgi:hypothetical protein
VKRRVKLRGDATPAGGGKGRSVGRREVAQMRCCCSVAAVKREGKAARGYPAADARGRAALALEALFPSYCTLFNLAVQLKIEILQLAMHV